MGVSHLKVGLYHSIAVYATSFWSLNLKATTITEKPTTASERGNIRLAKVTNGYCLSV
jgi:hypothetical protein